MGWLNHRFSDGWKVAEVFETREEARRGAVHWNRIRPGETYKVRRLSSSRWGIIWRKK